MAVTFVKQKFSELQGADNGHRTYVSTYLIQTDTKTTAPSTIWVNAGLPQYGDTYSWNSGYDYDAYCVSVPKLRLLSADKSARLWLATVVHTTRGHERDSRQQYTSPLDEPWTFEGDADEWTEEATRDRNGDPIQNSSLEPIRGIQKTSFRDTFVLSKNLSTLDLGKIKMTRGHCNRTSVTILGEEFPPRTLLCRRLAYRLMYYGRGIAYFPHTFTLAFNEEEWNEKLWDWGTREYNDGPVNDPKSYTLIQDAASGDVGGEYPLDGNGAVSATGVPAELPEKEIIEDYEFNVWNFPTSIANL